jgi:hypothetical protein
MGSPPDRFDEATLLGEARARTGLEDFGDEGRTAPRSSAPFARPR